MVLGFWWGVDWGVWRFLGFGGVVSGCVNVDVADWVGGWVDYRWYMPLLVAPPLSPDHTHIPPNKITRAQVNEETSVMLNGFGVVINALGLRCKPYLQQIAFTIKFRLNNKNAKVCS